VEGVLDIRAAGGSMTENTDLAWEEWGKRDPYFGVITDPKFRRSQWSDEARKEFFNSGQWHVESVLQTIRKYIDSKFAPKSILDFGCGVGRLLLPFAAVAENVVGVDVSHSMLEEARKNCELYEVANVRLLSSDDELTELTGTYNLVHSVIVFQHIPNARGRQILHRLLAHIAPGGVGALHILYSKAIYAEAFGAAPTLASSGSAKAQPVAQLPGADPEMQMNPYNMNEVLFVLQKSGVMQIHVEYTDHGGELGVFLFFQKGLADHSLRF
jgi:SAM-dependent methyltransferase